MSESERLLTTRDVARLEGVPVHRVRYAIDAHGIEPRQRAGIVRLWSPDDLPAIREAMERTASRRRIRGTAGEAASARLLPPTAGGER